MKRLSILIPVVLLLVNGCKRDGCNKPYAFNYDPQGTSDVNCVWEPMQLTIDYKVMYGDEEVILRANQEFLTEDGRTISFEYFGMYFSEIALYEGAKKTVLENDVMLLLDTNKVFTSLYLPTDNIVSIGFNIGINAERNDTLDPSTYSEGPLAMQFPNMYWGWTTGYIFSSFTGVVDTSAAADGSGNAVFEYHIGSNELLRMATLNSAPSRNQNMLSYTIEVDLQKVLKNVDFKSELSTHTFNNLEVATKIADNCQNAFISK
jgi:hypothetical protein